MSTARRFTIKGRVQGVFFRDSTRRVAESLGVTGHAINLCDGDVEVFACGDQGALDDLESWLRQGPPMASVSTLEVSSAEWQDVDGFRTG